MAYRQSGPRSIFFVLPALNSNQHESAEEVPEGHVPILPNQWRAVANNALITLQKIGRYMPKFKHQRDADFIRELTNDLASITQRATPRVEFNLERGTMSIGRVSLRNRQN
jgi:hypothetical protein